MPCSSQGYENADRHNFDVVVRLLCEANRIIDSGLKVGRSAELAYWWDEHQEIDRRRVAREAEQRELAKLADQAKSKLTPEERRALGL